MPLGPLSPVRRVPAPLRVSHFVQCEHACLIAFLVFCVQLEGMDADAGDEDDDFEAQMRALEEQL